MAGRPTNFHGPASEPLVERAISKRCVVPASVVPTLNPRSNPAAEYTSAGSIRRSAGAFMMPASNRIGGENVRKSVVVAELPPPLPVLHAPSSSTSATIAPNDLRGTSAPAADEKHGGAESSRRDNPDDDNGGRRRVARRRRRGRGRRSCRRGGREHVVPGTDRHLDLAIHDLRVRHTGVADDAPGTLADRGEVGRGEVHGGRDVGGGRHVDR